MRRPSINQNLQRLVAILGTISKNPSNLNIKQYILERHLGIGAVRPRDDAVIHDTPATFEQAWFGSFTVTPKTLSILTSTVVCAAHHQTPWESRLALAELNIEDTLGYKIAPWVM